MIGFETMYYIYYNLQSKSSIADLKWINKKSQKTSQKIWQIKKKGISLQPAMEKAAFYGRLA